eukprot:jgi/Botrbrau1/17826/Bobra.0127s0071.1
MCWIFYSVFIQSGYLYPIGSMILLCTWLCTCAFFPLSPPPFTVGTPDYLGGVPCLPRIFNPLGQQYYLCNRVFLVLKGVHVATSPSNCCELIWSVSKSWLGFTLLAPFLLLIPLWWYLAA